MQSHYIFNVSLHGKHFFATHERSVTDMQKAKLIDAELVKRFPESEGFSVTCTFWESAGKSVSFDAPAKDRYFTNRHGLADAQCVVLCPDGNVYNIAFDGKSITYLSHFMPHHIFHFVEAGVWLEFTPREQS